MARKSISRTVVGIAGIFVIIAVSVPVLMLVTGIGLGDVLPFDTEPPLSVPVPDLPDTDPILDDPFSVCEIDSSELEKIAQCEALFMDERLVSNPDNLVGECNQVNRPAVESCGEQIDLLLQDIINQADVETPVFQQNGTETSIDDPYTQLCDQNPTLIICGDSRSLELLVSVLKTDSQGNQTRVETTTSIPRLQFFVEDTSNIDFRNGQLQFEVILKGDPNLRYVGSGSIDLLIGKQSIFTMPLDIEFDEIADENGNLEIKFKSPTGFLSDLILFKFNEHFDKFADEEVTPVRLHLVELNVIGERNQEFGLSEQDIFTMNIARNDIQLIITDEEGKLVRVYPSDSTLRIQPISSKSELFATGETRRVCYDSVFRGNGLGCTDFTVVCNISRNLTPTKTITIPPPKLNTITIKDSENEVFHQSSPRSSSIFSFNELTRNQNYSISVSSIGGSDTSGVLDYGKSQEIKTFQCKQAGTANVIGYSARVGDTSICGYYEVRKGLKLNDADPYSITSGSFECNFPE